MPSELLLIKRVLPPNNARHQNYLLVPSMLLPLQTLAAITAEHTRLVEALEPLHQGKQQRNWLTTWLACWTVE